MDVQHTWEVTKVDYVFEFNDNSTPVCNIHWKLTTKNIEGFIYTSTNNGFAAVDIIPEEIMLLTKESALTLLLSTLDTRVQSIENENSSILEQMIIPVITVA